MFTLFSGDIEVNACSLQVSHLCSWRYREKQLQGESILNATFYFWLLLMNKQLSSLDERILHVVCLNISSIRIICLVWEFSCCSVAQSCPNFRPHGPKHARLPCPSSSLGACSNSCPLSRWGHPAISSCCPLLLLPSILPSIRLFSNELAIHIHIHSFFKIFLMRTMFKVCIEHVTILLPFPVVWS